MTTVKCNDKDCKYCKNFECQKDTIEIIYSGYYEFLCTGGNRIIVSYKCGSRDETKEQK